MSQIARPIQEMKIDRNAHSRIRDARLRQIPKDFRDRVEVWWHHCRMEGPGVTETDFFVPQRVVEMAGTHHLGKATQQGTYTRIRDVSTLAHERMHRRSDSLLDTHASAITSKNLKREHISEAISFATQIALFGNWNDIQAILAGNSYPKEVEELTTLFLRVYFMYGQADFVQIAQALLISVDSNANEHPIDYLLHHPAKLIPFTVKKITKGTEIQRSQDGRKAKAIYEHQATSMDGSLTDDQIRILVYFQCHFGLPDVAACHLCNLQRYTSLEEAVADESPVKMNIINGYRRLASTFYIQTKNELEAVRTKVGSILALDMADHAMESWTNMEASIARISELYGDDVVAEIMSIATHSTLVAKQIAEALPTILDIVGHDRTLATEFIRRLASDDEFRNFCICGGFQEIVALCKQCYPLDTASHTGTFYARHHLKALLSFPMSALFNEARKNPRGSSFFQAASAYNPSETIVNQITKAAPLSSHDAILVLIPRVNNLLWFITQGGTEMQKAIVATQERDLLGFNAAIYETLVKNTRIVNEWFWKPLLEKTNVMTNCEPSLEPDRAKRFLAALVKNIEEIENIVKGIITR